MKDGKLYYYEDGKISPKYGLIALTDDEVQTFYIYVRSSNKQIVTGKYWITLTNGYMDAKTYVFSDKGIMDIRNGIVAENGSLYYYVNGEIQYGAGPIEWEGNIYYVRSNGQVALVTRGGFREHFISKNKRDHFVVSFVFAGKRT